MEAELPARHSQRDFGNEDKKSPRPWGEDLGGGGRFGALKRKPTPTPLPREEIHAFLL